MRRSEDTIHTTTATSGDQVSIRFAGAADAKSLEWVAQRDTRRVPRRPLIVAEVGGRILAALSLADGAVIADPFTRTAAAVEMLELRAAQLRATAPRVRPPHPLRRGRYAHA